MYFLATSWVRRSENSKFQTGTKFWKLNYLYCIQIQEYTLHIRQSPWFNEQFDKYKNIWIVLHISESSFQAWWILAIVFSFLNIGFFDSNSESTSNHVKLTFRVWNTRSGSCQIDFPFNFQFKANNNYTLLSGIVVWFWWL